MGREKKQKNNLFTNGLLANAATATNEQTDNQTGPTDHGKTKSAIASMEEENDPLFGNTQRVRTISQQAAAVTDTSGYPHIPIEKLDDNPYQPRRRMNQKRLEKLAHEIQEYGFKGVLLARVHPDDHQRYQLVYGHRRREAAKRAGLKTLPIMIDNTINDHEMKFLALNENILRDDLTPLDEAYTLTSMLTEMSQDAVAKRLGMSRGYIRNRIDILKAPEDVQDMVEEKPDTMKAVVYLKDVVEEDIRQTAIQTLMNEEITINQLKLFIENLRKAKTTRLQTEPALPELPQTPQETSDSSTNTLHKKKDEQQDLSNTKQIPNQTPTTGERSTTNTTEAETDFIQQSKEQNGALTDKTKIESFTKYLQKYQQRLQNRSITMDEQVALEAVANTAKNILDANQ
jgi:ParB family chromosome partitioning protein